MLNPDREDFANLLNAVVRIAYDNIMYAYIEATMRGEVCLELGALEVEILREIAGCECTEATGAALQLIDTDLGIDPPLFHKYEEPFDKTSPTYGAHVKEYPYAVDVIVQATQTICEGGVAYWPGDPSAEMPNAHYIHALVGDRGLVVHVEDGRPTVRFVRTGTATIVAPEEIVMATWPDAREKR